MPQAPWKTPVEIKYLLEERLGIQVRLDNDCVMLALAEKWQNPAANEDFCVINVDYGIGSSFVIHDNIWRGSLYGSGQIGHTIVNPDGIACDCGSLRLSGNRRLPERAEKAGQSLDEGASQCREGIRKR